METTQLIIIRHGETSGNRDGVWQGHLDTPLTEAGISQAQATAERLSNGSFSLLYSSDLGRARETASIIARATGHAIKTDVRLRERALGIFEGLTTPEIQARHPEQWQLFQTAGPNYVLPGGESARQRFNLAIECLEEIAHEQRGHTIVVVTHGGVLNALFRHTHDIPLDVDRRFSIPNGAFNVFSHRGGNWMLVTWGDVTHLSNL
jgi:probable phosphoglycerate mutase